MMEHAKMNTIKNRVAVLRKHLKRGSLVKKMEYPFDPQRKSPPLHVVMLAIGGAIGRFSGKTSAE